MRKYYLVSLLVLLMMALPLTSFAAADLQIDAGNRTVTGTFTHPITDQERAIFGLDAQKLKQAIPGLEQKKIAITYKVLNYKFREPIVYADVFGSQDIQNITDKEPVNYGFKPAYTRTNTVEHNWSKDVAAGFAFAPSLRLSGLGFSANYPAVAGKGMSLTQAQTVHYKSQTAFSGQIKPEREFKISKVSLEVKNVTVQADITYQVTFSGSDINEILRLANIPVTQMITDTITLNVYGTTVDVKAVDFSTQTVKQVRQFKAQTSESAAGDLNLVFAK